MVVMLCFGKTAFAKTLTITNSATFPPFSFLDDAGKPQGLFIDLWSEWAKQNNQKIKFVLVDWNKSLELVRSGEADIHAGLFKSAKRERYMDFSDGLFQLTTGLFVSTAFNVQDITDLKTVKIGVTKGGFEEEFLRHDLDHDNVKLFDNNQELIKSASNGEITAFVADYPVGMYYLDHFDAQERFRLFKKLYSKTLYSAVKKGNSPLITLINSGMQHIDRKEIERIEQKWIRSEHVLPSWFFLFLVILGAAVIVGGVLLYVYTLKRSQAKLEKIVMQRTADLEQSNRVKTRFLSAASHDLRQPLQALRMFTETLASYTQNRDQAKLFANIQKCQHSIQSMLDSLLDISRLDAGMLQPYLETVAVPEVFEDMQSAFAPQAEARDIALFSHCPPDACIQTDPMIIERILGNLLGNAIRYTEGGMVLLACRRRGNSWRLEVRDSGAGIAEQDQASIFEEFQQLPNSERNREKGLGLGLAIVKRLCALLEYDIELRSMPGRGSTFAVTAPACARTLVTMSGAEANSGVKQPAMPFQLGLVIDDDTLARDSVFLSMRAQGCEVRTAANRQQAEQLIAQDFPDFIVCDYRLPDDNGIKLIQHLWQRAGHRIPSVLLTGDTAPEMVLEAEQAGIPVVNKPSGIAALFSALRGQDSAA